MSGVKMNPGWERAVGKIASDAFRQNMQPVLDQLARDCNGKSLLEAKQRLAKAWKKNTDGSSLREPELTRLAT
jgi:hypothetical protein